MMLAFAPVPLIQSSMNFFFLLMAPPKVHPPLKDPSLKTVGSGSRH
jgi:hypothetical protein